jgi:hypothetical protein
MTFLGLLQFRSTGQAKSFALLVIAAYFLMACGKESTHSPKTTGSNNPQIAGGVPQSQQQQIPAVCRGSLPKKDQLEYDYGDRHFTFVGWTHNVMSEQKLEAKYIGEMNKAAKAGDCAKVEKVHAAFLQKFDKRVLESQRVFVALDVAYQNHAFSQIGIEVSAKELQLIRKAKAKVVDDADYNLQKITSLCKDFDGRDVHMVFPGPEYEYAKESNGLVDLAPLEDHELKMKYVVKVSNELWDFDAKTSGLSPKTLEFIDRMGDSPSEQEERELLATESNPKLKEQLKRLYDGRTTIYQSVTPRNTAMIQALMKLQGNVAIVVGSAHINDFKAQLDQLCQRPAEIPVSGL